MWIVPWNPVLKLFLVKKVLVGPVNSARTHKKNAAALRNTPNALSKLYLSKFFIFSTSGTIPTGINSDFTMLIFHPETTSKHSTHFKFLSCSRHSHQKKKIKIKVSYQNKRWETINRSHVLLPTVKPARCCPEFHKILPCHCSYR